MVKLDDWSQQWRLHDQLASGSISLSAFKCSL
jgi:hypothetical protein